MKNYLDEARDGGQGINADKHRLKIFYLNKKICENVRPTKKSDTGVQMLIDKEILIFFNLRKSEKICVL